MVHLLLIDDDVLLNDHVLSAFPAPQHRVALARTGAEGLERLRGSFRPEVILLSARLPDGSGHETFKQIRLLDTRVPVIFTSVGTDAGCAIEAMKQGAFDYLYKPLDPARLRSSLTEAATIKRLPSHEPSSGGDSETEEASGALSGRSPAMAEVYKAIGRVAAQDVTVLVTGESGTGKELVARAIYQHRGAFTGADRRRIGKFEPCHGGTILLDEFGDMPLGLQAKILRLLQEQTFERVG